MPDLLGSILSGQSMLMMDSSDVVINRDGSLKATKSSKSHPVIVDTYHLNLFCFLTLTDGTGESTATANKQNIPLSLSSLLQLCRL